MTDDHRIDPRVARLTEARRQEGARKEAACLTVIERLRTDRKPVTFANVHRRAGVSSWFVYNNPAVRHAIEGARTEGTTPAVNQNAARVDAAGLRADLAHARDEVRHLREERDRLRERVRRGLGAALEQRDMATVIKRAEEAERQRDLLTAELHDARIRLAQVTDNSQLLREELDAARIAVKRMMRGHVVEVGT